MAARRQQPDFLAKKAQIEADKAAGNQANKNREARLKCATRYYYNKKRETERLGIDNYNRLKQFIAEKRIELDFDALHIPRKKTSRFYHLEILTTFEDLLKEIETEMKEIQYAYQKRNRTKNDYYY
jgi:hypothetical protein